MEIKICVTLDSYGHFNTSILNDREATIELLKSIDGGDYWNNLLAESLDELNILKEEYLLTIDDLLWFRFVYSFGQRGKLEINTLNIDTDGIN